MKAKFRITGKLLVTLLALVMVFTMGGLGSLTPAKTALAYESAPSDPQEAIIRQVLTTTANDLGWNTEVEYGEIDGFEGGIDSPGAGEYF